MSAYQDLMTALATRPPGQSAAKDEEIVLAALDQHAHELAEKIRRHPRRHPTRTVGDMAREIQADFHAGLIDPEVGW